MAQLFFKLAKDFDMEKSYNLNVYKEYVKTINPNYGIHNFDKIVVLLLLMMITLLL